ncbi:hypothetical protein [Roseateles oligotrophus]|uniref:Uncharacterized protein n=1 Tax=Roseateles oligotrophus TaxID=1769250 RepID=A0ABT2YMD0_9BURK|nr:hypothetical protein [Roseateles oligotrophus]MCV2371225.1 hypothetical protein [Roseateles oligotrophus]
MQSSSPSLKSTLIVCALAFAASSAWSAAAETSKPKNRVAAKATAALKAPAPEPEDTTPLNEEQMALSPLVHAGDANCEFKNKVTITPDADRPGRFRLQFGKLVFNMAPEPTTTGAVRLEDKRAGVVWLQIPTKSMLMNNKVGQRMVDFCMHSAQVSEAQTAALAGAIDDGNAKPAGNGLTTEPKAKP